MRQTLDSSLLPLAWVGANLDSVIPPEDQAETAAAWPGWRSELPMMIVVAGAIETGRERWVVTGGLASRLGQMSLVDVGLPMDQLIPLLPAHGTVVRVASAFKDSLPRKLRDLAASVPGGMPGHVDFVVIHDGGPSEDGGAPSVTAVILASIDQRSGFPIVSVRLPLSAPTLADAMAAAGSSTKITIPGTETPPDALLASYLVKIATYVKLTGDKREVSRSQDGDSPVVVSLVGAGVEQQRNKIHFLDDNPGMEWIRGERDGNGNPLS